MQDFDLKNQETEYQLDESLPDDDMGGVDVAIDKVRRSPPLPDTRSNLLRAVSNRVKKMDKVALRELLSALSDANIFDDESEVDVFGEDVEFDFSDDIDALVNSEESLSEEFKEKASVIFEAAVRSKVNEYIADLEENYEEKIKDAISEEVDTIRSDLTEKLDKYLDYVVEQWTTENEIAIETGIRTEIAESFMKSMKYVFDEHYVEVPDSKVDLVDALAEEVKVLKGRLNEAMSRAIDLNENVKVLARDRIINEAAYDLTEVQTEKLRSLAETLDSSNEIVFARKVEALKESYFKKRHLAEHFITEEESTGRYNTLNETMTTIIEESGDLSDDSGYNSTMQKYLSAFKKSTTK